MSPGGWWRKLARVGFVGLVVVLPVLGHATWHLYRKLVGR